ELLVLRPADAAEISEQSEKHGRFRYSVHHRIENRAEIRCLARRPRERPIQRVQRAGGENKYSRGDKLPASRQDSGEDIARHTYNREHIWGRAGPRQQIDDWIGKPARRRPRYQRGHLVSAWLRSAMHSS